MAAIDSIGVMENEMEATVVYWGYREIMENKMETTVSLFHGCFELGTLRLTETINVQRPVFLVQRVPSTSMQLSSCIRVYRNCIGFRSGVLTDL